MLKIKRTILILLNLALMATSWMFYKYPQGDEYLVLFMISLVFMLAPYIMPLSFIGYVLAGNIFFLLFYYFIGALNIIDIFVLVLLFISSSLACYLVRSLFGSFLDYYDSDIFKKKKKYNDVVNELETVDKRGRKIERELNRISRLYEITKQLAPVLKTDDLLEALFTFLAENFNMKAVHLISFSKTGNFTGKTKAVEEGLYAEEDDLIDYEKAVKCCRGHELKPFFIDKDEARDVLKDMGVRSDTFMAFPIFVGDDLSAIFAIEGAARTSYGRFRLLIPQITLEFRKVELYEQVQELSIIDGLTGTYLRRYLTVRLEEEVDRAQRLGMTFSVAMVDVDHFKECNDKYGHLVGDAVLKKIAERLNSSVREVDMIARYGGEEFCVVLPETPKKIACKVSERLRKMVGSEEIKVFDETIRITVSVGVANYPEDGEMVETLIDKADTALYRAKRKGRNQVCSA